jgi:hypothetical protein
VSRATTDYATYVKQLPRERAIAILRTHSDGHGHFYDIALTCSVCREVIRVLDVKREEVDGKRVED